MPGVPGLNGKDGSKGDQGPAGPPGDKGAMGPVGPKGEQGTQGVKGEQGAKVMQKHWKQCAWKALNDGRDFGLIKVRNWTRGKEEKILFHQKSNLVNFIFTLVFNCDV